MSLAYFVEDETTVLRPGVIENHSDLTQEEWLQLLQRKSTILGRRLSWREIKDDPELDHVQISRKLGPYSLYENRLFCSVQDTVQSKERFTGMMERNRQAAKAVKIHRDCTLSTGAKPIMELCVPDDDAVLWNPRYIVVGSPKEAEAETWLRAYRLRLGDCFCSFSRPTLRRIFSGESKVHRVSKVAVYPDHFEFIICQTKLPSTDVGYLQRIVATVKSEAETRLFLGMTRHGVKNYDEYAICGCKNVGGETSINVLYKQSGVA